MKCPCCEQKISIANMFIKDMDKIMNYHCPVCNKPIQLAWAIAMGVRHASLIFLSIMIFDIYLHGFQIYTLTLFGVITIFIGSSIFLFSHYAACLHDKESHYDINNIRVTISEKNMNQELYKTMKYVLFISYTLVLMVLICENIFSMNISPDIFRYGSAFVFLWISLKYLLKKIFITNLWEKKNARIVTGTISHRSNRLYSDHNDYQLFYTYTYQNKGIKYISNNAECNIDDHQYYDTLDTAKEKINEYIYDGLEIYMNPIKPMRSCIIGDMPAKYIFLNCLFFIIGIFLLVI